MTLRFRQTFRLFPGVRINVGKRGLSATIGVPGAAINVGRKGVRSTVGIPGSGLSYSSTILPFAGSGGGNRRSAPGGGGIPDGHSGEWETKDEDIQIPPSTTPPADEMRQIVSASVDRLTTPSLSEVRELLLSARLQLQEVESDLAEANLELKKQKNELRWKSYPVIRWLFKSRIVTLAQLIPETEGEIARLESWKGNTGVSAVFETGPVAEALFVGLEEAFKSLCTCDAQWDITGDRDANRVSERTMAGRTVSREGVRLELYSSNLISFPGRAMRFGNANGDDINIYPCMAQISGEGDVFALLDLREVELSFAEQRFIESERVPSDALVVGHTWSKANKDGSRDKRFNDNTQIPVCLYGKITMKSATGLNEEYMFSRADVASQFASAFRDYQRSLK